MTGAVAKSISYSLGVFRLLSSNFFLAKDSSQFKLSFQNAAHSECILLAEYLDYQHSPDIQFFHPPIANYHITKILKGPPLNKDLPIRYEFYDRSNNVAPPGWKFGKDKILRLLMTDYSLVGQPGLKSSLGPGIFIKDILLQNAVEAARCCFLNGLPDR